ncbi:MAG: 50S ribosomal protein L3 [Alphaproteobacteria bacterium]|nr:50S ribosomal protein L3 [Alphaproteobacteria bacterium]
MRAGIIAKKLGMTRFFREDGSNVPVTLIGVEKNYVTRVREVSQKNLKQVQIASGNIKVKKITKPIRNYFSKLKIEPKKKILEFKVANDQNINLGDTLDVNFFKVGQYVDVIGKSNGKGFAGSMKRHNFGGLRATHGVSVSHRSHGSTGQCQDPGRTFKGKKMAGHMGHNKVTMHNLEVVEINNEDGLILIKGSVPGSKGTLLVIRDAIKPKSLLVKIKKEEITEDSSKKEKKAEAKEPSNEKSNDQKPKEDKK